MNLESLLVSKDASLLGVLRPTLEKISVHVEVCAEARGGTDVLAKRKFDAVIVDCDDLPGGVNLLANLRKTESNAKSVSFAVLNGKTTTQQAFQYGANFVLQKPLTPLHATRCFHAALNFMERERRRYFRCPVEMPVHLRLAKGPEFLAQATNVSEGGMAVQVKTPLSKDAVIELRFTLPMLNVSLELKGQVAWADGAGRAGIRFVDLPQTSQYHLEKWLTDRLESENPRKPQGSSSLL